MLMKDAAYVLRMLMHRTVRPKEAMEARVKKKRKELCRGLPGALPSGSPQGLLWVPWGPLHQEHNATKQALIGKGRQSDADEGKRGTQCKAPHHHT